MLAALRARSADDPALSPDGRTWFTVADLLDRADRSAGSLQGSAVVLVPGHDPMDAVVALLAAQLVGAVPVLLPSLGPVSDRVPGGTTLGGTVLPDAARLASAGEPVLVLVTSGSGGRPRAVVRTARSWDASLPAYDSLLGPDGAAPAVTWVPGEPASTMTLFGLWHALSTGRPVIAPGRPRGTRAVTAGSSAATAQCVPPVLADVLDAREAGVLPRLQHAVVAGAALSSALRGRAERFGITVTEYYGAAELSFVASDPDGDGLRAFPGAELSVRDGSIWVRSPYLSAGYLVDDGDGALRQDGAGWASVGDLGALSDDGVLTVHGRGDGTACVGGTTVTLADVERALGDVPGVGELVALAEPDTRLGQRVIAVLRPAGTPGAAGAASIASALREAARARLTPAARPVRYVALAELPRTPGGKVARAALLDLVTRRGQVARQDAVAR